MTMPLLNKLEQVKKKTARFVKGDHRHSTTSSGLVYALRWDPLEQRGPVGTSQVSTVCHLNSPFQLERPDIT